MHQFAEEYVLGPGDQLIVFDQSMVDETGEPLTSVVPILPDGTATIYPFGVIKAGGLSLTQLNEQILVRSKAVYNEPRVLVSLAAMRAVTVYVLGAVQNPGRYSTPTETSAAVQPPSTVSPNRFTGGALTGTVQQTAVVPDAKIYPSITALTALQLAGGVRENADIHRIVVRKAGGHEEQVYDLWKLLVEGDSSQDVALHPGDTVIVPTSAKGFDATLLGQAANRSRPVRIFGAVETPGIYDLTPNDDLLSIIARAGGFSSTAVKSPVLLSRVEPDGKLHTYKVSIGKSLRKTGYVGRYPVQPGDAVYVRRSLVKQAAPQALTIGSVFVSAFFILFLSRRITDLSQPKTSD